MSEDDAEYTAFLNQVGGGKGGEAVLGYHYPEYRDLLLRVLEPGVEAYYLAARDAGGALIGILPGMIKRSNGYACYNSLPFFGPNVGALGSRDRADYEAIAAALFSAALEYARGQQFLTASFYSPFAVGPDKFASLCLPGWAAVTRVARFTQYLTLPTSLPVPWPSVRRRNIRKAHDAGVGVRTDLAPRAVDRLIEIYHQNCQAYDIPPKPADCVRTIVTALGCRATTYGAFLDDELIAGLIVFWGPRTASYYLPCSDPTHRTLQAGTLLIDAACREAVSRGVRYLNFESSPSRESGVYQFKKSWGTAEQGYEIAVARLCPLEMLRTLGRDGLARLFPFFFVYPFSELG